MVYFCGNVGCSRRRQATDCHLIFKRWMSASSKCTSVSVVRYHNAIKHVAMPAEN